MASPGTEHVKDFRRSHRTHRRCLPFATEFDREQISEEGAQLDRLPGEPLCSAKPLRRLQSGFGFRGNIRTLLGKRRFVREHRRFVRPLEGEDAGLT